MKKIDFNKTLKKAKKIYKRINKKKLIKLLIIIACIYIVLRLIFSGISLLLRGSDKTIYPLESGIKIKASEIDGNILLLSKEGIIAVDEDGSEKYAISQSYANPILYSKDDYYITFDKGANNFKVFNKNKTEYSVKTKKPIINAKVNSSGYSIIVTKENGYKSCVIVYDDDGEEYYKWQISNYNIIDAAISENCRRLCVCALSNENEKLNGKIITVDIDNEKVLNEITKTDTLFMALEYDSRSNVIAIGDNMAIGANSSGEESWCVEYKDKILEHYYIENGKDTVLVFTGNNNNSSIEIYNSSGKQTGNYITDSEITALDIYDNRIAFSESKQVTTIKFNGKKVDSKPITKDVEDLIYIDNSTVFLITPSGIDKIHL